MQESPEQPQKEPLGYIPLPNTLSWYILGKPGVKDPSICIVGERIDELREVKRHLVHGHIEPAIMKLSELPQIIESRSEGLLPDARSTRLHDEAIVVNVGDIEQASGRKRLLQVAGAVTGGESGRRSPDTKAARRNIANRTALIFRAFGTPAAEA